MATERSEHQKWYDREVDALVELGVDLIDAEARQQWILDNLPYGEDPATYIFPGGALYQDPSAPDKVQDAAAAYIASDETPSRFKRLLHAKQEDEQ